MIMLIMVVTLNNCDGEKHHKTLCNWIMESAEC